MNLEGSEVPPVPYGRGVPEVPEGVLDVILDVPVALKVP